MLIDNNPCVARNETLMQYGDRYQNDRPYLIYRRKSSARSHVMPQRSTLLSPTALEEIIRDLSVRDQKLVLNETTEFLAARAAGARSYLEMGRHLERVQQVLEPTGKFLAYIQCVPNLSQATAYRNIWAWQNAQRLLPPATREEAMTMGIKLISWEKDGDFTPQFKRAIAKVEREMGLPPDKDHKKAEAWLHRLLEVKRELSPKTRIFHPENASIRLLRAFQHFLDRIPPEDRRDAAARLIGMFVRLSGVPLAQVRPVALPTGYSMPRRGRPATEREDIA